MIFIKIIGYVLFIAAIAVAGMFVYMAYLADQGVNPFR